MQLLLVFCMSTLLNNGGEGKGLKEVFTWTKINYRLPHQPSTDEYVYENNVPMGANIWRDKLFIAVPRRREGIPSTLNYVSLSSPHKHNAPLIPYPDYVTNAVETKQQRENRLTSVYRVAVDPCDRLWFVDTGVINVLGNSTRVAPRTLNVIDLNTNRFIRRHIFKDSVLKPTTALVNVEIDVTSDTCEDAFAYIPDLLGYGLVVYSFEKDDSWRVDHDFFRYQDDARQFSIGGLSFEWDDGVFSIALSAVKSGGHRDAYFHSMSGTHLFRVSTRILRNETLATRKDHGNDLQDLGDRGSLFQSSASKLHQPTGVLFYGLVNRNALGCWNTNKQFKARNFDTVEKDDVKFVYPSDVKIYGDDLVVITNKMPIFVYGKLNYDEVNFRVWSENVYEAIKGTHCN